MNPGNLGPPDDSPWMEPTVITFPPAPYPGIHRFGYGTLDRQEVYVTNPLLSECGLYPVSLQPQHTIKVWAPPGLRVMQERHDQDITWTSHDHYKRFLRDVNGNLRVAGIFVNVERSRPVDYRVIISGQEHRITIRTPKAISDLMVHMGFQTVPEHMNGIIWPKDVRFLASRNYTDWMSLEQLGLNGVKTIIPNPVQERIRVRLKIKSLNNRNFRAHLTAEYVILPEDLVNTGLTDTIRTMLDSSGVPTLELWRGGTNYPWYEHFPVLPGVFNNQFPVPAICERYMETDLRPSEWTLRRLVYDVFLRSRAGSTITNMMESINWFRDSQRTYTHDLGPVLIIPQVPDHPANYNYPTRLVRGDEDGPYDRRGFKTIPGHPAYQQQVPLFDQAKPETAGGQPNTSAGNNTDSPENHEDKGKSNRYLTITALGKYQSKRDCSGLINKFQTVVPDITGSEASTLANLAQACVAERTARTHSSIKNCIQKLFPSRKDIFLHNQPGDELRIIAKMKQANYSNRTVLSYIRNYERIVINSGGTVHPRLPEVKQVMKGLQNLNHNPAEDISTPARKAYSVQSLQLVGEKGAHLMKKNKSWDKFRTSLFRAVIYTLFFGRLRTAEALGSNNARVDLMTNLLAEDVIIVKDEKTGELTSATLHLRNAKYKEKLGALVVIPALKTSYCPVKALNSYINIRQKLTGTKHLPLFLVNNLWGKSSSKPVRDSPGVYTQQRFRKDVQAAIKELVKDHPELSEVTAHLKSHSLRAGIPTELQSYESIPEEIR